MAATVAPAAAGRTPISAAGNRPHQAGLTLIELLVVLLIMAATAGVVVFALPRGTDPVESAMGELESTLEAAIDRAILSGRPLGLTLDEDGFAFAERVEGDWAPMRYQEGTFRPGPAGRPWPDGVRVAPAPVDGGFFADLPPEQGEGTLLIRPRRPVSGDAAEEADEDAEPLPDPDILISPTGEVTPFSLTLTGVDRTATLEIGPLGEREVRYAAR